MKSFKRFYNVVVFLFGAMLISTGAWAGINDRFSDINLGENNVIDAPQISAPTGNPIADRGWLYVKDNGGTMTLYFEDDAGSVTSLFGSATLWNAIGNPTGANAVDMTTHVTVFDWGGTADMMTHEFTGAFGDVSGLLLEQKTGNPTDGTMFEIKLADTDPDFLSFATSGVEKVNISDDGSITLSAGNLTLGGDLSISGTWSVNAITAATATQTLMLNGNSTGGVSIGVTSTGNVTLGDDVVVSDTYDVTIGEGSLTIDNDQNEDALIITPSATTFGSAVNIIAATTTDNVVHATADNLGTGGAMIHLDTDNIAADNFYFEAYNGSSNDYTISQYGAVVIRGNASTDVLTLTAGDLQISNGDIDLDNGQLAVDTTQDIAHNLSRNFSGAGSAALVTINEDNTSSTSIALAVNNDGTGNSTGVSIVHDGDLPALSIAAGAARTGNAIDVAMANMLAQNGLLIDGAWTGASDIGMINLNPTGSIAAGASVVRIDTDTGTPGGSGFGIEIDDDSVDGGTYYSVLINSANNEGLHVEAGLSLFAEIATFTLGIDSDAAVDIDLATAGNLVTVDHAANDLAAGAGVITVYDDSTGQTNLSYLLRLAREADGDAQDGFLLFEDASTGAAANGDDMFAVGPHGTVTMGGTDGKGGSFNTSWEDLTIDTAGTAASIVVMTTFITTDGDFNEDNATLADATKGMIKHFAIAAEGAGSDTWKITPANLNGGSKISFDGVVGDGCSLLFDGTRWNIIGQNGGTIS